jgi:TP901 family phage tail tape measure protein
MTSRIGTASIRIEGDDSGLRSTLGGLGKTLGKIGFAAAAAGVAAFGGAMVGAVRAAANFDGALTESLAIMGDVSDALRNDMADAAREVALSTTFSATQAAEAYFFLASAGLDATQSIAAMPQVAAFAQAGMFDMSRATDLLTDAQSALGLASDDATENLANMARISDVLVGANTLANASVEQFSEALTNKAGAALRLMNKDVEEGVAVLAFFADQGVKGTAAGEALSIVLRDVTRAAARNTDQFAALGIQVFDAEGNLKNMADVVAEFEGALDGMSDAQIAATLDNLGLTRSVGDNIKQLLGGSEAIRGYEADLRGMSGVTNEIAGKQLDTFNNQMSLLRSRFTDIGIELGNKFLPTLTNVVKAISSWIDANRELIFEGIDRAIAAIGRIISFMGNLWSAFREGEGVIGGLRNVIATVFSGAGGFDLTGLFTSLLSAVQSVIGRVIDWLATGGITQILDTLLAARSRLLDAAMQLFPVILDALIDFLPKLISFITDELIPALVEFIVTGVPAVLDAAVTLFESLLGAIIEVLPMLLNMIVNTVIPSVLDMLIGAIPRLLNAAITLFLALVNALPRILPVLISAVIGLIPRIIDALISMIPVLILGAVRLFMGLVEALPQIIPALLRGVIDLGVQIVKTVIGIGPQLLSAGATIIGDLAKGILDRGKKLIKDVKDNIVGALTKLWPFSPAKEGPLRRFPPEQAGENIMRLFAEGIDKGARSALASASASLGGLLPTAAATPGVDIGRGGGGGITIGQITMPLQISGDLSTERARELGGAAMDGALRALDRASRAQVVR